MNKSGKSMKSKLASWDLYDELGQKETERSQVCAVLDRLGIRHYEVTSSERPDFLIHLRHEEKEISTGCEVSSLFSDEPEEGGSPQKGVFQIWKRIATKLREQLDEAELKHDYGVLFFKEESTKILPRINRTDLIAELVAVCQKFDGTSEKVVFPVEGFPLLNSLLNHLCLLRYPEEGILWWCSDLESGSVPDPTEALQARVKEKTRKAVSYDWGDVDHRWLILVAEGTVPSSLAAWVSDPKISEIVPHNSFTWIILWDRFTQDVIEIYPTFQRLCDGRMQERHLDRYPQVLQPFIAVGRKYPVRARGS